MLIIFQTKCCSKPHRYRNGVGHQVLKFKPMLLLVQRYCKLWTMLFMKRFDYGYLFGRYSVSPLTLLKHDCAIYHFVSVSCIKDRTIMDRSLLLYIVLSGYMLMLDISIYRGSVRTCEWVCLRLWFQQTLSLCKLCSI